MVEAETEVVPRVTGRSYVQARGTLATTLMQLIDTAGLNVMSKTARIPSISEQYKAMRLAARDILIDDRVRLNEYFCTYLPALPQLMAKIGSAQANRFTIAKRPHGLLIFVAADAAGGRISPLRGEPIPVRGRIAIFGEREGHSRQTIEERRARSPYLAACVVGPASPGGPIEVLKAYLHPCAAAGHLMPMDSDFERKTLAQLVQLQAWLRTKLGVAMTVRKPIFDVSPTPEDRVESLKGNSPGPFIPDFLLEVEKQDPGDGPKTIIVETMGYADEAYRHRKLGPKRK